MVRIAEPPRPRHCLTENKLEIDVVTAIGRAMVGPVAEPP